MSHFVKPTYTDLADLCRYPVAPSRVTDGLIFRSHEDEEGDVWSDLVGDDNVWHRRDPEDRTAWQPPQHYTTNFGVALSMKVEGVRLLGLEEPQVSDDPWVAKVGADVLGSFRGEGTNAALAFLDGYFQALARLHGETGSLEQPPKLRRLVQRQCFLSPMGDITSLIDEVLSIERSKEVFIIFNDVVLPIYLDDSRESALAAWEAKAPGRKV
ncbi:hypothetical protein [Sphingomonas sp. 3-13AW]|uniref:hypothetical protein n=1 Tax=Sphingomonas sp. 3-13AW TaxID=3050450 RepID=UPI003BB744A3